MSDPLNSVVFINDTYNEYSNGNSSKYKRQDENFEAEDTEDESTDDNYIKVKINKTKIMGRINTLEKQNKVLKTRLDDATDENLALRENNIKFQVEIFRLRRKITEMEANEEQEQKPAVVEGDFFAEPKEECRPSAPKRRQPVNPVEVEVPVKKPKQSKPKPLPPPVKDSSSEDDEEEEPEVKVENKDLEMQPWNGIKFTKAQRKALNDTIDGKAGDSKFINQICMFLWDDLTLINSSVTGIPSNNTNAIAWSQSPLDPDKLKYLKSVFKKRLQRENLDKDEATERAKRVNALINNKINNLRRGRVLNKQAKAKLNSTV